jgi:hypothetical protein
MKYLYLIVAVLAIGCICLNQYISNQEVTQLQNECNIYCGILDQTMADLDHASDQVDLLKCQLNSKEIAYKNLYKRYVQVYNKYRDAILYYECYDIQSDN